MTLTKDALVERLQRQIGYSPKSGKQLLELLLEIMKSTLEQGEDVKISNFGRWSVREKQSRRGRNPHTGDAMIISARKVVTFHPSDAMREKITIAYRDADYGTAATNSADHVATSSSPSAL